MADNKSADLIIIGGGPGGYVAAVRAAQLDLKTVVVEKEERLGGVCLNRGCIPSKALLDSSEYFHLAKNNLAAHGVKTGRVTLDLPTMMARKDQVVADLTTNVRKLLERHNVDIIQGEGKLIGQGRVAVTAGSGETTEIAGRFIMLATGSRPVFPKDIEPDGKRIISSTEALKLEKVPKTLGVLGGGYIGLELGSVWHRLGAKVTILEMLPAIGANLDGQIARSLDRILRKQGLTLKLGTTVASATVKKDKVVVETRKGDNKETISKETISKETISFDQLLVCSGRRPLTKGLGLEGVGVEIDQQSGSILVDETYRTNIDNVYAIGDLVAGPMLAHKASAEGVAAVEHMAGHKGEVNYDAVPSVIYTFPEVAAVGLTEQQVKERDIPYCTGTYPFMGSGRARCLGETDGMVKLIAHAKTDRILGVHIISARAAEMIAECTLALEFGASSEDIARTIHGHPTFAEALQEAAMAVRNCSIYSS